MEEANILIERHELRNTCKSRTKKSVAICKAISLICLHGAEIGSIDLPNSKTYKLKNSRFAYFLHFPNASWLRSFRPPWGLGGKRARRRDYNASKQSHRLMTGANLQLRKYHYLCSKQRRYTALALKNI